MKKVLFVLAMLIGVLAGLSAQDIIVKKNSERIDAKILEVGDVEIKYKQWAYQDGPTFVIHTSEISSIIYANGQVSAFNTSAPVASSAQPTVRNGKSKFSPEPQGRRRPFGLSIGYVQKQIKDGDDESKVPWMYIKDKPESKPSSALQVGFTWMPEFRYGIGLNTGIFYELSTETAKESGLRITGSEHTLSIPLRIQYRYEIIEDLSVFLYTGPSFDMGLAYIIKATMDGGSEEHDLYDPKEDIYKRFNILWGVGAGVRWKGLQLRLGGDWGLVNMSRDEEYQIYLNKPFYISLSYQF